MWLYTQWLLWVYIWEAAMKDVFNLNKEGLNEQQRSSSTAE